MSALLLRAGGFAHELPNCWGGGIVPGGGGGNCASETVILFFGGQLFQQLWGCLFSVLSLRLCRTEIARLPSPSAGTASSSGRWAARRTAACPSWSATPSWPRAWGSWRRWWRKARATATRWRSSLRRHGEDRSEAIWRWLSKPMGSLLGHPF